MDCEAYKQLISRHVDGMLTEEEGVELEKHLTSCSSCEGFLRDLKTMRTFFEGDPAASAPAGMSARVMEAARPELAQRRSGVVLTMARRLCAAALLVAALTVGLVLAASTEKIQAVDKDLNLHYEDFFQRAQGGDGDLLEILMRTDNPDEALRIYKAEKRGKP